MSRKLTDFEQVCAGIETSIYPGDVWTQKNQELKDLLTPRPLSEWHEDFGPVLWWRFPIVEPPYVGSPLDDDFLEDYYDGWTRLPEPFDPPAKETK